MSAISQASLLIVSFLLIFFWNQLGLSKYGTQVIGFLVFVFIVASVGRKGKNKISIGGPIGIFILNTILFILIFATGGISSSLFFMLYFLIFAIGFAFNPLLVFIFAVGAFVVFIPQTLEGNTLETLAKAGTIMIISPLAYFFGNQFRRQDENDDQVVAVKERAQEAADTISKDVESVLEQEKTTLKSEDVEKLSEVLQEAEDLRAETKEK